MKSKILSIGAVVLLAMLTPIWAADIFGSWIAKGTLHESFRTQSNLTNAWVETVFNFKANGTELTGTVTDADGKTAIREGKINGDEISFVVIHSVGGNERKLAYKGQVSLNEIRFTVEGQGLKGQLQEFIAKREFPRHGDIPVQPVRSIPHPR
jgi:hypothetical protein